MTSIYDYMDATELDNLAYKIYLERPNIGDLFYTQKGFVGSVGCEKFYNEGKIRLRQKKIKN